ncbi:MAG: sodium:solute symporter family protein [bacterium]|nr:sodium:solute symporter family protein [bacterium]
MFGLPLIDILVILVYFVIVLVIGVWASRHVRNEEDFFLAGRRFGKAIQTFAAFGQGTSADNAVGVSTTTFHNGASGIWSSLLYLFATPVYWFTSAWMRRLRIITMGDFFTERYGSRRMAGFYSLIGAFGMMAFIALGLNAMAKTVVAITPKDAVQFTVSEASQYEEAYEKEVDKGTVGPSAVLSLEELREKEELESASVKLDAGQEARLAALGLQRPATAISHLKLEVLVWGVCIIVMLYAAAGGLEAAFLTDTLQGVGIIVLSIILIPFAWGKINLLYGGEGAGAALTTIHARLPDSYFDVFGSPHAVDFTWYYIIALSLMALLTVIVQPNMLVTSGSARDEYAARYGFVVGSFMKRFCTVLWGVFGLAAIVLYSSTVQNSDMIWGYATRDLLGPLGLGLVGLMIACLMAALMSTADCLMLTCSSLLTHNLYRQIVSGRNPRHYVWAGRIFGGLVLVGAAWIALQFDTILQILKFIWEMNVALVPAFWLGMKWRRANRWGAWVSILAGVTAFLVLPLVLPALIPQLRTNSDLLKRTDPAPLVRTYAATEADQRVRQAEIQQWQAARDIGEEVGTEPQPLATGEAFTRTYKLPRKGVFWTQGVEADSDGVLVGKGGLSLELVLLDKLGWDLSQNPHAWNETIRILIRTLTPILLMWLICLMTPRDEEMMLKRFYAKMRTRVQTDRQEDAVELAASLEDPHRHDHLLLFQNSNWEFYRWNRQDTVGFLLSVVGVFGILGFMYVLLTLGG